MVWLKIQNWIAVLSARITQDPSIPSQHIYSHSSKDIPKWRPHAFSDGNDCWRFQTSYCIKEWEEKGASDKSEKQKAGKVKQWEGKHMDGKGEEKNVNQATDFHENAFSVSSGKRVQLLTPFHSFFWKSLEIHVGITELHVWLSLCCW